MKVPGSSSWMSEVLSGVDWYESVVDLEKECKPRVSSRVLQPRSSSMSVRLKVLWYLLNVHFAAHC